MKSTAARLAAEHNETIKNHPSPDELPKVDEGGDEIKKMGAYLKEHGIPHPVSRFRVESANPAVNLEPLEIVANDEGEAIRVFHVCQKTDARPLPKCIATPV